MKLKLNFAKKLALNKFLLRIEDVIIRDEIHDLLLKAARQNSYSSEDRDQLVSLLTHVNIPVEDYEKLVKQLRR